MKRIAIVLTLLTFGVFLGAGNAVAINTGILLNPGSEVSLIGSEGILDLLYGLDNLTRIPDNLDQEWNPATGSATPKAQYAGFSQDFGYILQSDGIFRSLFNVPGGTNGHYLGAATAAFNSGNVNFLWALDPSGAPLWTSDPLENSDGLDHMVTWRIDGNVGGFDGNTIGNFVIAWEDLSRGGDRDFNDLVVEVSGAPVPEPSTMLLLGAGLIGLAGFSRRKFKK